MITLETPIPHIRYSALSLYSHSLQFAERIYVCAFASSRTQRSVIRSLDVCSGLLARLCPSSTTTSPASARLEANIQPHKPRRILRIRNSPLRPSIDRASLPPATKVRDRVSDIAKLPRTFHEPESGKWKSEPPPFSESTFGYAHSASSRPGSVRRAM